MCEDNFARFHKSRGWRSAGESLFPTQPTMLKGIYKSSLFPELLSNKSAIEKYVDCL